MTRFVSPARSADGRPAPPINGQPRPAPRTGTVAPWVACGVAAFVLLLLIFVLQNGQSSDVHFLGMHGQLPTGVALLLAVVFGVLLVSVPAVARLLRSRLSTHRAATPDITTGANSTNSTS
jgi:uncharacterized integral membrane protein